MAERLKAISNTLKMAPKLNENGIPSFDDLPLRKGDPHHSAWGLYGDNDELGTLNRLTDERVAAAARDEIRKGTRVSLNWPLDAQGDHGFFQRKLFHQELFQKPPRIVNDDVWTFNSQVSSQWDGFRHFGYQKEKKFYNGVTLEDIHGTDANGKKTTVNGIQGESGARVVNDVRRATGSVTWGLTGCFHHAHSLCREGHRGARHPGRPVQLAPEATRPGAEGVQLLRDVEHPAQGHQGLPGGAGHRGQVRRHPVHAHW